MLYKNLKSKFKYILGIFIICFSITSKADTPIQTLIDKSPEPLKSFLNGLMNMTCEVSSFTNNYLLQGGYANTCVTEGLLNLQTQALMAPILFQQMIARLRLNDTRLFGNNNCSMENRADPDDPHINFYMCNNLLLIKERAVAFGNMIKKFVIDVIWGKSFDDAYSEFLNFLDPTNFFCIYENKSPNDYNELDLENLDIKNIQNFNTDFGPHNCDIWPNLFGDLAINLAGMEALPPSPIPNGSNISTMLPVVLPWKLQSINDKVCVSTTISPWTWVPVGCKYTREPLPTSVYQNIVYPSKNGATELKAPAKKIQVCTGLANCFVQTRNNSKALSPISSTVIYCINQMLAKLMISNVACDFNSATNNLTSSARSLSILFQFQKYMHTTVQALLTLYVVIFGFKLTLGVLGGEGIDTKNAAIFVFKIILVTYFTFGLQFYNSSQNSTLLDGMTQWVFPVAFNFSAQLASWVANATPSGLCDFSKETYSAGYEFMSLWDSLDCRVGHYLGVDMLSEFYGNALTGLNDPKNNAIYLMSFPVPIYVWMILISLYTGIMPLFTMALMYPILVIAIAGFVVQTFAVSMIMLVILGTLTPIFIPMVLFERTKEYFDGWLKLFMSFILQPMLAVAFTFMAFSLYDRGFYGTCKYTTERLDTSDIPGYNNINNNREALAFTIDMDESNYSDNDYENCINSLGYILNSPFAAVYNAAKGTATKLATNYTTARDASKNNSNALSSQQNNSPVLKGISNVSTAFVETVKMVFAAIYNFMIQLLVACLLLFLISQLTSFTNEFMASLSGGISISGITIGIQSTVQILSSAAQTLSSVIEQVRSKGKPQIKNVSGPKNSPLKSSNRSLNTPKSSDDDKSKIEKLGKNTKEESSAPDKTANAKKSDPSASGVSNERLSDIANKEKPSDKSKLQGSNATPTINKDVIAGQNQKVLQRPIKVTPINDKNSSKNEDR